MNWYDLPACYDLSFSHEMKAELEFLKKVFRTHIHSGKASLLEPACGTGRLVVPLVRAGFDCTGFDLNRAALDYLKKNLQETASGQMSAKRIWRISHLAENALTVPIARSTLSGTCCPLNRRAVIYRRLPTH